MSSRFAMVVPSTSVKPHVDDTVLDDFPKRLWTTAPLSPMRIKKEDGDRVRTWMDLNPEHRYELLTDGGAETYVKDHFPSDNRISKTYLSLGDYIMRADLIRYLALLQDGGVYNDLDVGCLRPIDLWIPPAFKDNTSVVLGIEVDNEMGPDRSKLFELVNWTIMSRRNAPFMRFVVDRVIENLEKAAAKHNTTLFSLQPKRQEVIDVTGPAALTQAAFQYLSEKTQTTVNMQNFTKMRRPKLVADILVLPINAFGAGHQVQWSGTDEDGSALVHHYFAGSWKTNHFDGPTEEEKKAKEAKKKEEARKIKEESEKRKAEEVRRKKEEDEKKKAEVEEKARKEAEANKQQVAIENQPSEQGHKEEQGQVQQGQQSDPEQQNDEEQQDGQEQEGGQEQENGEKQKDAQEEQQDTKQAEQPGQDQHAGQMQKTEQKTVPIKVEEKVNKDVLEQEKRRAIEELQRVHRVRAKTREEAIKKIIADRKKDVEEREKDEEIKKKLAQLEDKKSKQKEQQAPVQKGQPAPNQGQVETASKEPGKSKAPAQQQAPNP
ncbi:MAG: hypothetical protein L6R38_004663 [Xanthoria sp. 2 TBL-2021]|nr:MAG: hypothetical protein L6R38_004663 [Xanthoria sp. 2 TBL-2021]